MWGAAIDVVLHDTSSPLQREVPDRCEATALSGKSARLWKPVDAARSKSQRCDTLTFGSELVVGDHMSARLDMLEAQALKLTAADKARLLVGANSCER